MDYPQPHIIEPLRQPHKQTFILLHGRGSSGNKFGSVLLDTPIVPTPSSAPADTITNESPANIDTAAPAPHTTKNPVLETTGPLTLAAAFPHARFIFPTAARRRATLYKRAHTHQWFDNWKLDPHVTEREELQIDGLKETTIYLHELLRAEIARVPGGAANIVLGGLSQGCAASLTALLLWEGERLGAAIGMCGYLPFAETLLRQLGSETGGIVEGEGAQHQTEEADGDFDPFLRDEDYELNVRMESGPATAVSWLSDELQLDRATVSHTTLVFQNIPIFLGHGVEDDRVSIVLGRRATECLTGMSGRVWWNEYEQLGHWYSGSMLQNLVDFIRKETSWDVE